MRLLRKECLILSSSTKRSRGSTSNPNPWDPKLREPRAKIYRSSTLTSEPSDHLSSGELGLNMAHKVLHWIEGGILADFSFTPILSSLMMAKLMHSLQSRSAMNL